MKKLAVENQILLDQIDNLSTKNQTIQTNFTKKQKTKEILQKICKNFDDELQSSREQHRLTVKELESYIEENCRLQQEIVKLKEKFRQLKTTDVGTTKDQVKIQIEKLNQENHNLQIDKSELLLEIQTLKALIAEDNGDMKKNSDLFNCRVTNVVFDMLFNIIVQRRKEIKMK